MKQLSKTDKILERAFDTLDAIIAEKKQRRDLRYEMA